MQESDAIVPPVPLSAMGQYGLTQAFTHFRHTATANVSFLDGHVENLTLVYSGPDPSWPANFVQMMQLNNLGFPTSGTFPYLGK